MSVRKKKDENNYHKKRQKTEDNRTIKITESADDFVAKMIEAMPPAEPLPRPSPLDKWASIKAEAEANTKARMARPSITQPYKWKSGVKSVANVTGSLGNNPNWDVNRFKQLMNQPMVLTYDPTFDPRLNKPSSNAQKSTAMPTTNAPKSIKKGDIVMWRHCAETPWIVTAIVGATYADINPVHPQVGSQNFVPDRVPVHQLEFVDRPAETENKKKHPVKLSTVIMPDEKRQQIMEALEQVKQQDLIFDHWGFNETIEKGKGVSFLFYGPPGTGKTLAAQGLATELKCKLKILTIADIQSNVPGQAERNIRKHFEEAKTDGKTILLFDECDSIIFTRAHVGPIMAAQINELLSQLERYEGFTVFTTNRLGTLDEAVNRRLALKLEFAMPTPSERVEIWKRMFPKKAPLSKDIDWMVLASIEMSGGYIKNAVLRAARMAAAEKIDTKHKKITMDHLIKALKYEAQSMIDFEEARDAHRRGFGHVAPSGSGLDLVQG
jgi:AAA+ superfamily predicted ATPase